MIGALAGDMAQVPGRLYPLMLDIASRFCDKYGITLPSKFRNVKLLYKGVSSYI